MVVLISRCAPALAAEPESAVEATPVAESETAALLVETPPAQLDPAASLASDAAQPLLCLFFGEAESPAEPFVAVCLPAYAGHQGTSYANPHAATQVGSDALTYDQNGNLLTKGSNNTYAWDYANRLYSSATGTHASAYSYDASGQRVKLVEDGITTLFPSGGYEVTGGIPTKQIEANGVTVATVVGTGASAVARYVHTDHLTGSNVVTSQFGAVDETLDYYPYGGIMIDQKSGTYGVREKYAGHDFDQATGLSYMGARYYDSSTGRFLSQDPMFLNASFSLSDPQSLNAYSYARNNPLVYIDPDGRAFMPSFTLGVARGFGGAFMSLGNAGANFLGHPISTSGAMASSAYAGASGTLAAVAGYAANPSQMRSDLGAFNQLGNMARSLSSDQIASIGGQLTGGAMFAAAFGAAVNGAASAITAGSPATYSKIGSTGAVGENDLKSLGGQSQKYFDTPLGGRRVDQYVNGVAHESKVGYQALTKQIGQQIQKDSYLAGSGDVSGSAWHFYDSPVTGRGGPSAPLQSALNDAGIKVIRH